MTTTASRTERALSAARADLLGLAGSAALEDGGPDRLVSPTQPSPTVGESALGACAAHAGRSVEEAWAADDRERAAEVESLEGTTTAAHSGRRVHPPHALSWLARDGRRPEHLRFPGEHLVLLVLAIAEIVLLKDPIQTAFYLSSGRTAVLVAAVVTLLVVACSHVFGEVWARAQRSTVPAAQDRLRVAAAALALPAVVLGLVAVLARLKQEEVLAEAGGPAAAAASDDLPLILFIAIQVVFVAANLGGLAWEVAGRTDRWLEHLKARRSALGAEQAHATLARAREAFTRILFEAAVAYRNGLSSHHDVAPWRIEWAARTGEAMRSGGLLREMFPGAPADPGSLDGSPVGGTGHDAPPPTGPRPGGTPTGGLAPEPPVDPPVQPPVDSPAGPPPAGPRLGPTAPGIVLPEPPLTEDDLFAAIVDGVDP